MRFRLTILICLLCSSLTLCSQDIQAILAGNKPLHLKADTLNLEGRRYMFKLKYDSAKYCFDLATKLALESRNSNIICRCYIDYVSMYCILSRPKEAEKYMLLANPFLEKADIYEVKASGLSIRANLCNLMEKKDSALYYYQVAERYNFEKNPYRNWMIYMAIGDIYNQADDRETAEKYFLKAYNLTVKQEGKPDHIYLLTVFLNFYLTSNNPADAAPLIQEFDELQEERRRKGIKDPLRDIMLGMTTTRLAGNVNFMKSVKEKGLQAKLPQQALIANTYLVSHFEKKDLAEALRLAEEGEEIAKMTGSLQNIYGAKRVHFSLLQKAGRHDEAGRLAGELLNLKDSMLVLQKRDQVYELEAKFETEKKQKEIELLTSRNTLREKEIALLTADKRMAALLLMQETSQRASLTRENSLMDSILKKEQAFSLASEKEKEKQKALNEALERENKLKAGQLTRERNTKWILAGGALLVLVSGMAILALYRRQRNKNKIIEKQAADLEVLMKEIHHRVKNNLQIVSSLLDLQSHTITDAQAHEAVKEGKNRVQSMALIHQNLYSEDNIKGIRLREYITNLLQALCDSYNMTNDKVRINTQIDDLNLDVETMIPLGLTINELVSNCFKYAFRQIENGELNIRLQEKDDQLHLLVRDNGKGFPEGLDMKTNRSFGLKMIRAFAQKLKAKLNIYNDNGAVVEMIISKFKLA